MELFVLSDWQLASLVEWQRAISAEGFPLQLLSQTQLATLHGSLPARLGVIPTGFEFAHVDADDLMAKYSGIDFGHRWRHAFSFRWDGADLYQNPAALMASAAYAKATGGMVLDCVAKKLVTPQHTAKIAREFEADIPVVQEILRRVAEGHKAAPSGGTPQTDADEPTHVVTGRWLNRPK
jgi:hypothetical protein